MEAILQLPRALRTVVEDRKIVVIGKGAAFRGEKSSAGGRFAWENSMKTSENHGKIHEKPAKTMGKSLKTRRKGMETWLRRSPEDADAELCGEAGHRHAVAGCRRAMAGADGLHHGEFKLEKPFKTRILDESSGISLEKQLSKGLSRRIFVGISFM